MLVQVTTQKNQPCSLRGLGCSSCANASRCGVQRAGVNGLGFNMPDLSTALPFGMGAGTVAIIIAVAVLIYMWRGNPGKERRRRLKDENERHQAEVLSIRKKYGHFGIKAA